MLTVGCMHSQAAVWCQVLTLGRMQSQSRGAVQVMSKICREAESSLDYYSLFKSILKEAPMPMSPLESLASSAVRTAHKVRPHLPIARSPSASS